MHCCEVDLVADGWMQFYASSSVSDSSYSVCYGANAGAGIYAQLQVPSSIGWLLGGQGTTVYPIYTSSVDILPQTCPIQSWSLQEIHGRGLGWTAELDFDTMPSQQYPKRDSVVPAISPERWGEESGSPSSSMAKRDTYTVGPLLTLPFALTCPSSTDDETGGGDVATCPLCSDESDDELDLYTRGEVCDLVPYLGGETFCSTSDVTGLARRGRNVTVLEDLDTPCHEYHVGDDGDPSSPLDKRMTTKTVQWRHSQGLLGTVNYVEFGQYPSCGEATNNGNIAKWFVYGTEGSGCNADVSKVTKSRLSTKSSYVTEHVFEAQILLAFWNWLVSGTAVTDYTLPSYDWVTAILLNIDTNTIPSAAGNPAFSIDDDDYIGVDGWTVQECIAFGFGNSDIVGNERELVLASAEINGAKNTWFGGGTPDYIGTAKTDHNCRLTIRNAAGVFNYLGAQTSEVEAVWNKFKRPSNWIDLVFYVFDKQYPWGQGTYPGEPSMTNGQTPSMRSLWAKFLDSYLANIEANAAAWGINAKNYYTQAYPPQVQSATNWMSQALNTGGWATSSQMRFPRPGGAASVYGVYGNPSYTFNYEGNTVNIGAPTKIP